MALKFCAWGKCPNPSPSLFCVRVKWLVVLATLPHPQVEALTATENPQSHSFCSLPKSPFYSVSDHDHSASRLMILNLGCILKSPGKIKSSQCWFKPASLGMGSISKVPKHVGLPKTKASPGQGMASSKTEIVRGKWTWLVTLVVVCFSHDPSVQPRLRHWWINTSSEGELTT